MRLVTFANGKGASAGVVGSDGTVAAVTDLVPGAPEQLVELIRRWAEIGPRLADPGRRPVAGTPLEGAKLLAPIPRPARNLFCVGWNYAEHFAEGKEFHKTDQEDLPEHPAFFSKNPRTVVGPDQPVRHPRPLSDELDWEVELAVVIAKEGRDIPEDRAMDFVFGYTIANDVSVRDLQRTWHGGQWFKGKNFDTHCPLGPWVVTADEIPDPHVLAISSRINGEAMQSSNTRNMVFSVARIIAELSAGLTLEPGDVILTGTPPGVGFARKPPRFLEPGDVMEMQIEGIGVLRNRVA